MIALSQNGGRKAILVVKISNYLLVAFHPAGILKSTRKVKICFVKIGCFFCNTLLFHFYKCFMLNVKKTPKSIYKLKALAYIVQNVQI